METSKKHEEIKLTLELVSGQFEFLKNSRVKLLFVKNIAFIGKIGCDHSMKRRIATNGHDEALFDQNGVIKSHPCDQGLT